MPVIDLGTVRHPSPEGVGASDRLAGLMAFPGDPEAREEMLAAVHATALAKTENLRRRTRPDPGTDRLLDWFDAIASRGLSEDGGFAALARGPGLDRALARWRERSVPGQIAGEILLFRLRPRSRIATSGEVVNTVRKAAFVLERHLQEVGSTTDEGIRLPASRASIMGAWSVFKGVSHLWATHRLLRHYDADPGVRRVWEDDELYRKARARGAPQQATLGRFLAVSEVLRQEGEEIDVLSPVDTWRAPPDLDLKKVEVKLPPLPPKVRIWLREYRRRNR